MDKIYYHKGAILVTDRLFRSARPTYRISDIEKITLRRPFFWGTVPLAIACYILRQFYGPYLYNYEHWVCIGMYTGVPLLAWFIGTLTVTSKSLTNDTAVTGFMPTLKKIREAVERAIYLPEKTQAGRYYADMVDE